MHTTIWVWESSQVMPYNGSASIRPPWPGDADREMYDGFKRTNHCYHSWERGPLVIPSVTSSSLVLQALQFHSEVLGQLFQCNLVWCISFARKTLHSNIWIRCISSRCDLDLAPSHDQSSSGLSIGFMNMSSSLTYLATWLLNVAGTAFL